MKNTMKLKSLLSFFVPAAILSLSVASCSDYDNGYTETAIKYAEDFRKAYGDIDPEQDWNLAERATVTVSTLKESNIKIYALLGDEYSLVGNYEGIKDTKVLGVDVIEGTRSLLVTDGCTVQECAPGGLVVFNGQDATRTVYGGNDVVKAHKLDANATIGPTTYPQYIYADADDYEAMKAVIPEIGYRKNYTNLNRVTHDFTYRSNGQFIIYPYYWETSSNNTIGVYYYDNNGNRVEVNIYKIKEGDEVQYRPQQVTSSQAMSWSNVEATGNAQVWKNEHAMVWTRGYDNLLKTMGLPSGNLLSNYTDVTIQCTMKKKTPGIRLVFYKDDGTNRWVSIDNPHPTDDGEEVVTRTINLQALVNEDSGFRDYLEHCSEVRLAGSQNESNGTFTSAVGSTVYGDIIIDQVVFEKRGNSGNWQDYTKNFCSEIFTVYGSDQMQSRGILVDIPVGTKFGMYLKKSDTVNGVTTPYTFYSEGSLNDPFKCGNGVIDDNQGHVTEVSGLHPCYASTFHDANGRMYLGFEDWPNDGNASDFDLNDVVFVFDGTKPTIINEDPEPAGSWMLACEDLGGTFDCDYNDLVLKITHISGESKARLTPLASGGTLASYIFFVDPLGNGNSDKCFGEIHQLFGAVPAISGEYEPINAGYSRGQQGETKEFDVPTDWTMAYYSTNTFENAGINYSGVNMGGFEIRTLPKKSPIPNGIPDVNSSVFSGASRIPAPDKGAAPYIICMPYSYVQENMYYNTPSNGWKTETFWAWPQELVGIDTCYPDFKLWVEHHDSNGEWYKNKREGSLTVADLKVVSYMSNQQGGAAEPTTSDLSISASPQSIVQGSNSTISISSSSNGNVYFSISPSDAGYMVGNVFTASDSYKGNVTITAIQDATGTYQSGTASTTLTVTEKEKQNPNFQTRGQFVVWNNQEIWDWNTTGYDFSSLTTGDKIKIETSLPSDATGEVTAWLNEKDGTTGSILSEATENGKKVFYFTAGPTSHKEVYIRINYSGDNKYKAVLTSIRIRSVIAARIVRFKYYDNSDWALTHGDNGVLQLQSWSYNNIYQMWRLEAHGQDDKGHNLYALFNLGARKYLRLNDNGYNGQFVSEYTDNAYNKFEIENNRLRVREYCRNNVGKYAGIDQAPKNNLTVFLDKSASYQIINWSAIEDVDVNTIHYNTSNAKRRNAGKK